MNSSSASRSSSFLSQVSRLLLLVLLASSFLASTTSAELVPDAGKMVFFDMQYGFQSGSEREPTLAEIEELICMTNRYLQSRITTSLESQGETRPVQAFATNIDWSYDFEGSPFLPFSLNFTADVTFATPEDAGVRVDKQVIYDGFESFEVTSFITEQVWTVSSDNVFYETVRISYDVMHTAEVTPGKLYEATSCWETRMPTMTPEETAVPAVSATPIPTSAPKTRSPTTAPTTEPPTTLAPTVSASPSSSPTASPTATTTMPSTSGTTVERGTELNLIGDGNGIGDGDGNGNGDGSPTTASEPVTTTSVESSYFTKPTMKIDVQFLVSNMDGILAPEELIHNGLSQSWPQFVQDLVQSLEQQRLKSSTSLHGRLLATENSNEYGPIVLDPNSMPVVYQATKTVCGPYADPGLICHDVNARFDIVMPDAINKDEEEEEATNTTGTRLLQSDETEEDANATDSSNNNQFTMDEAAEIRRIYQVATYQAINDGTYYAIMKRQMPDSPLYIGAIPPPHPSALLDGETTPMDWIMIVIMVLLALTCCCILGCILQRYWETRQVQKETTEPVDIYPQKPRIVHHLHTSDASMRSFTTARTVGGTVMTPDQAYDEEMGRQELHILHGSMHGSHKSLTSLLVSSCRDLVVYDEEGEDPDWSTDDEDDDKATFHDEPNQTKGDKKKKHHPNDPLKPVNVV